MILRFTIPIPPGLLAINRKMVPRTRRRRDGTAYNGLGITREWKAAFDEAVFVTRQIVVREQWATRVSLVRVFVLAMWPRAKGDTDAVAKAIPDVLEHAGVVIDDALCKPVTCDRVWLAPPGEIVVTVEDVG